MYWPRVVVNVESETKKRDLGNQMIERKATAPEDYAFPQARSVFDMLLSMNADDRMPAAGPVRPEIAVALLKSSSKITHFNIDWICNARVRGKDGFNKPEVILGAILVSSHAHSGDQPANPGPRLWIH